MTTLHQHMQMLAGRRQSVASPRSNIDANFNTAPFGMNNYVVEYSSTKPTEETEDPIEKYEDDSLADKTYNRSLLTRQKKPEVVEQPVLGTNPTDFLDNFITGSEE